MYSPTVCFTDHLWGLQFSSLECRRQRLLCSRIRWIAVSLRLLPNPIQRCSSCPSPSALFLLQYSSYKCTTNPCTTDLAQGADALALIGGLKNVVSFVIPFYINPMVASIGVQSTFVAMAIISLGLFFVFVFSLVFCGERLREWSGQPGWNRTMVRPPPSAVDAAAAGQD